MKGRKLSTALLGALVGVILASSQAVFATHTPADKVVASGRKAVVAAPGTAVELLRATLKTSKPTDLILQVSMECSIITDVQTGGTGVAGAVDSSTAEGTVRAWVEIDGQIVPIMSASNPPQPPPPPGDDTDKVTFCNRVHQQDAEDTENAADGLDKYRTYLETKEANSFNWLRLNLGSSPSPHVIVVRADLTTDTVGTAAGAEAIVGNRSMIVEPAKLANDATIT